MRTPLLALSLTLTLSACQVQLPGFSETRITGTREGEAAGWTLPPAGAPAQPQAPGEAAPAGGRAASAAPAEAAAAPPAAAEAALPPVEAPAEAAAAPVADSAMALMALKAYVDAYKAKDPAKVASFEASLLAARRKAELESAGQFQWSIERGHAEIFLKGEDFRIVTAALSQIAVERKGEAITLRTRDGSPLLRATFNLDGASGSHEIAELVVQRDSAGKLQVAALPFGEADPGADEANWPLPEGPIVTGAEREAALDVVAALNDAYTRKDAEAVAALLPGSLADSLRARLGLDLADALFSVRPLARELLTVVAVDDGLLVVGPRAVIASFPFKRDGALVQVSHGAIRLAKDGDRWVIARSCDTPGDCD